MSILDTGDPTRMINVDGMIVERDALSIAERLKEIDPDLEVMCINPEMSGINDAPFIIAERCPDGNLRRIFECWELNKSVIDRVLAARMTGQDLLAEIDKKNNAVKLEQQRKFKDEMAARSELTAAILRSQKSKFTFKDGDTMVTIHENKPAERTPA